MASLLTQTHNQTLLPQTLWTLKRPFLYKRPNHLPFRIVNVYSQSQGVSTLNTNNLSQRREKVEANTDPVSILNERIRRHHSNRDSARPVMNSEEANHYIQLVKQQQQRGLQKLKGDREAEEGGVFSYRADPYLLRSGDYVVHKKVGIGRFVGIKFDVPKGSTEPIEYAFIEYADGMAKLSVKQASRMLYRYNLPTETKRPKALSKLSDINA
ncbi:hypothetical protein SLA2020_015440 [Shorea laevis]